MQSTCRLLGAAVILAMTTAACRGSGGSHPPTAPTATPTNTATKALWIANGTDVVEFLPTQLTGTGDVAPHLSLQSAVFGSPQGVLFDGAGNLWVVDGGNGSSILPAVYKFTPAQLAEVSSTPAQTPSVSITTIGFKFPQQAVFDKSGNLWVSDDGANAIYEFSASQLVAGGNLTPNAIVESTAFAGPLGIAFDAGGDLFIANNAGTTIDGFFSSTLPQTGTIRLTPNVVLSDDGAKSIQAPWALVFDASGNLWSSNANPPSTIVEFPKSALVATGSPVPAITLNSTTIDTNATLAAPNGIAFDPAGDLAAISSATPFGVTLFTRAQLGASGSPTPSVFIVGTSTTLSAPAGAVFGPVVN